MLVRPELVFDTETGEIGLHTLAEEDKELVLNQVVVITGHTEEQHLLLRVVGQQGEPRKDILTLLILGSIDNGFLTTPPMALYLVPLFQAFLSSA